MSLQSDFELCLEYAEELEAQRDKRIEAQENIIFMQNESEKFKKKLKLCNTLSVVSAIGGIIPLLIIMTSGLIEALVAFIPFVIIAVGVFSVAFSNRVKIQKEYNEFEARKPAIIQKYVEEAEECKQEMTRLIMEIEKRDLFEIVPADYFCVAAIEFCLTQMRKKLANTATDAFRQLESEIKRIEQMEYIEELHSARMEELNGIKKAIQVNTLVHLAEYNKRNY